MLIKYIRKGKRQKKGVLVAVPVDGQVRLGWSLCHKRDKFNKEFGKKIAISRALCGKQVKMPPSLKDEMNMFVIRASRYYKDKEVVNNCYIEGMPVAEKYNSANYEEKYALAL